MAITTDSVMTNTMPTVLQNARDTELFTAVMSGLVWRIQKQLHDGKTVNVPTFGTVTARSLAEGVDNVTSETMSDTGVTITPAEVGCKIILTDKLVRDDNEDIKAAAGRMLGNAMELKRDQDLLGQLANAATSLGGGATATLGQFAAARSILKGNPITSGGPARGNPVIVHHPYVTLDIVDVMTPLLPVSGTAGNNSYNSPLSDDVIRNYGVGRLFGMTYIEDGNIDTTTIANTAKGGVFVPDFIILATANEWSVEPQRDASLRATELNITGEYGVGTYITQWGVTMNHDATLPA